jgi:hypothetical protein
MHQHAVAVRVVVSVAREVIAPVDDQHLAAGAGQPFGDDRAGKSGSDDEYVHIHS